MENLTKSFEDMENSLAGMDAATLAQLNKKPSAPVLLETLTRPPTFLFLDKAGRPSEESCC
jgi:hypothetical protein